MERVPDRNGDCSLLGAAMQVSSLNEVKIYSLSCGKSLPEVSQVGSSSSRMPLSPPLRPWQFLLAPGRPRAGGGSEARDGTWGS